MTLLTYKKISLLPLLGLSLSVHAAVFFAVNYFNHSAGSVFVVPQHQQGSSFAVALNKANTNLLQSDASQKEKADIEKHEQNQPIIKQHRTTTPQPTLVNHSSQKTVSNKMNPDITPSTVSAKNNQQDTAMIISQVSLAINQHFKYPSLARRKGWQGKVLLEFNVTHKGYINNIAVKNSSGYKILDYAAKESLSLVQRINFSDDTHLPQNTRLLVPVIYQLYEG